MHKLVNGIPVELTPEEIAARDAEVKEYKAREAKVAYRKRRAAGYPTIGDQLDVLWKWVSTMQDLPDEVRGMANLIKDIKEKYPKQ